MLKTRALVAAVALPILLVLILFGGTVFAVFVLAALLLAGQEYTVMLRHHGNHAPLWLVWALIALAVGAVWFERSQWLTPGLILLLMAGMFWAIWRMEKSSQAPITDLALTVWGGVYIGWLGSTVLGVRLLDDGAYLTIVMYTSVAFTDSAAYFVGRKWGRRKLAPRVSPKKTWEGYFGSVVSGPIFGALVGGLVPNSPLGWGHGAILGLLIGVLGTLGDLGISVIKRQVGVKDSSHLIPGHGGFLDRLDSVFVAAAITFYYLTWFVV